MTETHEFKCDKCGDKTITPYSWGVEPFKRWRWNEGLEEIGFNEIQLCYKCDNYVRDAVNTARAKIIHEFMKADLSKLDYDD